MEFVGPHQILDEILVKDLRFDDPTFDEAMIVQNQRDKNIIQGRENIYKSLFNTGLGKQGRSYSEWEKFGVSWIDSHLKKRSDQIETVIAKNLTVGALRKAKLSRPYEQYLDTIPVIDAQFYIYFNTMILGNVSQWGKDEIDWCDLEMFSLLKQFDKLIQTFSLQRKSQLLTRQFEFNLFEYMKLTGFNKDELDEQGVVIQNDVVKIDPKVVRQFQEEWYHSIDQLTKMNQEINDKQRDPDNKTSVFLEALINQNK